VRAAPGLSNLSLQTRELVRGGSNSKAEAIHCVASEPMSIAMLGIFQKGKKG
jgi:hypothetical protein